MRGLEEPKDVLISIGNSALSTKKESRARYAVHAKAKFISGIRRSGGSEMPTNLMVVFWDNLGK